MASASAGHFVQSAILRCSRSCRVRYCDRSFSGTAAISSNWIASLNNSACSSGVAVNANSRAACVSSASRTTKCPSTSCGVGIRTRVPARGRLSSSPSTSSLNKASDTGRKLIPISLASVRREMTCPSFNSPRRIRWRTLLYASLERLLLGALPRISLLEFTLWSAACEICGFVSTARALVCGHLRVRTQRTRPVHHAVANPRRRDRLRSLSILRPLLQRADHIEGAGAIASAAMAHPGHHEQPVAVTHRSLPAYLGSHRAVIVDAALRSHARIVPPMILNQLSAMREERP